MLDDICLFIWKLLRQNTASLKKVNNTQRIFYNKQASTQHKQAAFNHKLQRLTRDVYKRQRLPVRIQRLVPFIDDFGLIRVRGRLTNSAVTRNRFPILLPKHHHLVGLLIHHTHVWLGHACLLYTSRCV